MKKRFRVPIEVWHYYGVYVEAETVEEAAKIVQGRLDKDGFTQVDDEGEHGIRVVEDWVDEIDQKGYVIR